MTTSIATTTSEDEAHGATLIANMQKHFPMLVQNMAIELCREIASNNNIDLDRVEDVYPCTPMQTALFSTTSRDPIQDVLHVLLNLKLDVSLDRFRAAWQELVQTTAILRTRIVRHDRLGLLQVVLREEVEWIQANTQDEYMQNYGVLETNDMQRLTRYAMVRGDTEETSSFIWTIHHSLSDASFLSLVIRKLGQLYQGHDCEEHMPFKSFVAHIFQQNRGDAEQYWRQALQGCEPVNFPNSLSTQFGPSRYLRAQHQSNQIHPKLLHIAPSTLAYAAWAKLMSCETSSDDVVFGGMDCGGQLGEDGNQRIAGPAVSITPIRVQVHGGKVVSGFLKDIEEESRKRDSFACIGISDIAKLNSFTEQACEFNTMLVVQPTQEDLNKEAGVGKWRTTPANVLKMKHNLTVQIFMGEEGTKIIADYDSRTIEGWKVKNLLAQFSFVMKQLAEAAPGTELRELDMMGDEDRNVLWTWNANVPSPVNRCLPELVQDQVRARPNALAIHAWDGDLTYTELNNMATQLACQLIDAGVGSEEVILLCFERSLWAIVALLAVLKAGAAICMLDPSHPENRLRTIVQQTGPRIVLSSASHLSLSSRLVTRTMLVGPGLLTGKDDLYSNNVLPKNDYDGTDDDNHGMNGNAVVPMTDANGIRGTDTLPMLRATSPMYIIFTSGSTGQAKGSLISHSAFCSGVYYQASKLGMKPTSRVLNVAAHAFDVFIYNTGATLATGGCLCLPADTEAKDDLANCIRSMEATYVDLTPSVARLIDPQTVPSVESIILGGEASTLQDLERWWKYVAITNAYGPSECTANSLINHKAGDAAAGLRIGKGAGVVTWIVDPRDHNILMPIGAVGELLLEGPLLGIGYLNDAEKTSNAFIENPPWLLQGATSPKSCSSRPGRRGRLYKTGDLVRYNDNGSISYIGRKDTQVKIRGQRVELGEVERHTHECMAQTAQLAAEVITLAGGATNNSLLVIFLCSTEIDGNSISVQAVPTDIENQLAERLPSYMIPSLFIHLSRLPTTSTDKIDRKRLREIGAAYSAQQLADFSSQTQGAKRMPSTEVEHELQQLWSRILNISAASIGIDDSFFRLGGDSITAMQIAFEARSRGIPILTGHVLRKKTISNLSQNLVLSAPSRALIHGATSESTEQPFGLTPVQQLYLGPLDDTDIRACFDQNFFLGIKKHVSVPELSAAFDTLVYRHSMLRARFQKDQEGRWEQFIASDTSNSVLMRSTSEAHAAQVISQSRAELNVVSGPRLVAVLVDNNDSQSLFIAIHHLVVDLVSWRVLLQELEHLLLAKDPLPPAPPISFQSWRAIQAEYVSQHMIPEYPQSFNVRPAQKSYWGLGPDSVTLGTAVTEHFVLNEEVTSALLGDCNSTFNTRPFEIMIAALMHSFTASFPDRACPPVFNETHGREIWTDDIDLSRTVGWFTSMFPIQLDDGLDGSLLSFIRGTKDAVRSFAFNGWAYFASQFLNENTTKTILSEFPTEIAFNYFGVYQQLERTDSLFRILPVPESDPPSVAQVTRFALFDFNVSVWDGCIDVELTYDRRMKHQDRISAWMRQYEMTLIRIPHLSNNSLSQWTLSDFPLAFKAYDDLDQFAKDTLPQLGQGLQQGVVEDIFPCSSMQQGMLISQGKDSSRYRSCIVYEAISSKDMPDIPRLQQAWSSVVRRHSILRTLLVDGIPGSSRMFNIVLKNPRPRMSTFEATGDVVGVKHFRARYDPTTCQPGELPHHFSICQLENKKTYICLDINHAIIDGHSQNLILRDLQAAYDDNLDCSAPLYRDVIAHFEQQSHDDARQYWKEYLKGVEPCFFPNMAMVESQNDVERESKANVSDIDAEAIRAFCSEYEVSTATLIKTAWALVLSRYTGTRSICFGGLASARDIPIREVDEIVGPLISMLSCRVQLDDQRQTVLETLEAVNNDYVASLPHQSFPLAAVHQELGLASSALFNTTVSIQRLDDNSDCSGSSISFENHDDFDPTEYDIAINAFYSNSELEITFTYLTSCLAREQAEALASCLSKAFHAIITTPQAAIQDLDLTTKEEKNRLFTWNAEVPIAVERCLHELVEEQAKTKPDAPAIYAWDGELTYRELDDLASRLAYQLVSLGVSTEIVPLCFEKSVWTTVAQLAVLKAGGAICMIDPSYPESRLQTIIQQVDAKVILSSASHLSLSSRLVAKTIPVGSGLIPEQSGTLPRPNSTSMMCIIYTSGTTGVPKGSCLTHSSFSSGIHYQTSQLRIKPASRVLDFAAYVFDVSIYGTGITLSNGACLCVPSEVQRRDSLESTICSMMVTHLLVTPSVSRLIRPESVRSTVETVVFAGEQLTLQDAERWWKYAVINTYGPSECTSTSVCNYTSREISSATRIGKGSGVVTWIVDERDHNILAPIGVVGELLLEGPLVGHGYLNNPANTAVSFINDPPWLLQAGRHGRLYKTGDLVYYHQDGSLSYAGRKDTQVKIRGQRVELDEIEQHVRDCMLQAREANQLAVEVIRPGDEVIGSGGEAASSLLAVFLSDTKADGKMRVLPIPADVEEKLAERIPSYMLPTIYFSLPSLPMTTTHKINRKHLRELGASITAKQLADLRSLAEGEKSTPLRHMDRTLQKLWSQVLNIDQERIGMDDSFIRLGGDSITAMQLSFEARSCQIPISTSDILQKKTIRRLTQDISSSTLIPSTVAFSGDVGRSFGLTPIQRLYLELQSDAQACFDQCFFLHLREEILVADLSRALNTIANRHSMLRARFNGDQGIWQQYIAPTTDVSIHIECTSEPRAGQVISQSRALLDVVNGPLVAAVLVENDAKGQSLFIAIHHLVIDLLSWRVLLQELENLLRSKPLPPVPSISFQAWYGIQADYVAQHPTKEPSLPLKRDLSYWGLESSARPLQRTAVTQELTLTETVTNDLLGDGCNGAFKTRPFELMVAALIYSFSKSFPDRDCPPIFNETHGRKVWTDDIDLSRTIGWFTSMFPIQVEKANGLDGSLLSMILGTKDSVRRLPSNGWSYLASPDVQVSQFPVEIIFNYFGLYQQLERGDSLFKDLPLPEGCDPSSAFEVARFSLFEINIGISEGRAIVSVTYDKTVAHQNRITSWIQLYEQTLNQLPGLLRRPPRWTLSDFPLALKSYSDLSRFQDNVLPQLGLQHDDIEDVFPCSPMQEGILISQTKDLSRYWVCTVFEAASTYALQGPIDLTRLQNAWRDVVRRHAILRTLLLDRVPGSSQFFNIVLRDPEPSVSFFRASGESIGVEQFRAHHDPTLSTCQSGDLPHHLSICELDNQKICLCLDFHHAIMDAHSQRLIMRDLEAAYGQGIHPDGPSYRNLVAYLHQQSQDEALQYWTEYLDGVEPCLTPNLAGGHDGRGEEKTIEFSCMRPDAIRTYCRQFETTTATIVQVAWALVLRQYTGSTAPCFGNLLSGRDLAVDHVNEIVGPLINMLTCRVQFNEGKTVLDMLEAVRQDYITSLAHQSFPLAEVHRALHLGQSALFNTILSFQNLEEANEDHDSGIAFSSKASLDPTEYDIAVYATQTRSRFEVAMTFDTNSLTYDQAEGFASCLRKAIDTIVAHPHTAIHDLDIATDEQKDAIWRYNADIPPYIDECIHTMFEKQVWKTPDAPAVHAWDGKLTYRELDNLATKLAYQLVGLGIMTGDIVPLCFEKSLWATVAMVAVLKSGGAICMLDPAHPENRLRSIAQQTDASVILSSTLHLSMSSRLGRAVAVGTGLVSEQTDSCLLPPPDPSSLMYVAFTSGSTGLPKGSMNTHGAFRTALHYQTKQCGFTSKSRILDLVSYAWDVAIYNNMTALTSGGCLHVPSDSDRKDNLMESVVKMEPTIFIATPTLARLLQPESIPSLETIILVGEAFSAQEANHWWKHATVMNSYGPTECTPITILNTQAPDPSAVTQLGRGAGAVTWVVDPTNSDKLSSPGAVGELLLEGPLIGKGYLKDPEKTAAAYIVDPAWLLQGTKRYPGRHGRLYKTGDLVRYSEHGSGNLMYMGRKDSQVKIRGQRVELGEVEPHVAVCMPQAKHAQHFAVEVITPRSEQGPVAALLAVFLCSSESDGDEIHIEAMPLDVEDQLAERLPSYMVPTVCFVLQHMPITSTHKVNRKRLREIGASYSLQQLADLRSQAQGAEKRMPSTEVELILQRLWAQVLHINPASVGADDSFFRLGGDSVAAMKLVAEARKEDLELSVADIFRQPRLSASAQSIVVSTGVEHDVLPFSLIGNMPSILDELADQGLDVELIEDAYPCTSLQEGLLSLTTRRPGDYVLQSVLQLSANVDLDLFCAAWERTVQTTPILRTRIVHHEIHGLLQVVLKEQGVRWLEAKDLDEYLVTDKRKPMGLAQPLSRYCLVRGPVTSHFVWTVHHALYDGASRPLIMDLMESLYRGDPPTAKRVEYKHFMRHVLSQSDSAADTFWKAELKGYQCVPFPPLPPSIQEPRADSTLEQYCELLQPVVTPDITVATIIRAAWAMVAYSRAGIPDVVFGTTVSGRNAPIAGIESIIGPTIATIPTRVQVQLQQTVAEYLQQMQNQMTNLTLHEQTGLRQIARLSPEALQACEFQTLLVVQPSYEFIDRESELGVWHDMISVQGFSNHALTLNCLLGQQGVRIVADYDSEVLHPGIMQKVVYQFSFLMQELASSSPDRKIGAVDTLVEEERKTIWEWNSKVPETVHRCVFELFEEQVQAQPNAPAVDAWDGKLSYGELSAVSTRLAYQLIHIGIRPGDVVPLCFEKSMWATVAMLAVWKAGGTICMLEPAYPKKRLQAIVDQLGATAILCSPSLHSLSSSLAVRSLPVGPGLIPEQNGTTYDSRALPPPNPSSAMYVVFTSGSTGLPKGAFISHSSFCSGIHYQADQLRFMPTSRVFDFASYAFDMPVHLTGITLATGGCLCVASEADRKNDLMASIIHAEATIIVMTPSIARLMQPKQMPSVQVVILGGEPSSVEDMERWWNCGKMTMNVYGPSECTPLSVINCNAQDLLQSTRIGKGTGVVTWVVDAEDHNKLVPIGVVGEVILEGPLVGNGHYLNDPKKTAAAYIEDPIWLLQGSGSHPGRSGRLYKTGDLVQYNDDGSLTSIGRKDTQVKIRGQRVELGEVEQRMRECMRQTGQTNELAAEVITPSGESASPLLAVFLSGSEPNHGKVRIVAIPPHVEDSLSEHLPSYMIPTVYLILPDQLPMTSTHKIDRRRLREIGATFSAQQLADHRSQTQKLMPSTDIERRFQQLWSHVLNIDIASIGVEDSFFRLGGDSIAAMKLVAEARMAQLAFSVADVFRHPRLSALAQRAIAQSTSVESDIPPFSLVNTKPSSSVLDDMGTVFGSHGIDVQRVEDIYPCTPLQEGLLSLTTRRPGDYVLQSVLELSSIDLSRFRVAWEHTIQACAILRTRLVYHDNYGLLQAVIKDDIRWLEADNLDDYLKKDKATVMGLGQPLARYALIYDSSTQQNWFVWTMHHALYDGMSQPRILELMHGMYEGTQPRRHLQYKHFIRHVMDQRNSAAADAFWRSKFKDCQSIPFPALPPSIPEPRADSTLKQTCAIQRIATPDITLATILQAAWAMTTHSRTNTPDIVFGATFSGRNAQVTGIEAIIGPTIATVPVRVKVQGTVGDYLHGVQQQMADMSSYEQTGLQQIARLSAETKQACEFQTLLVVQPVDEHEGSEIMSKFGIWRDTTSTQTFSSYALTLNCYLGQHGAVHVVADYDSRIVDHWTMRMVLDQFDFLMQRLAGADPGQITEEIPTLPPNELGSLWNWNYSLPPVIQRCFHELVEEQARERPHALAIDAWDGRLTYSELDTLASRLSCELIDAGITPGGDVVPLCFEKSMWTMVALLAVLKAGGAICMLDPTYPEHRLRTIVRQIGAKIILTSVSHLSLGTRLVTQAIPVGPRLTATHNGTTFSKTNNALPRPDPSSLMYVIFTSGSTGTPKGSFISHSSFCSGLHYQVGAFKIKPSTSRVLDFANYIFDVFLYGTGVALANGACLCIPSETDRRENLGESIRLMGVTHLLLTPSVARLVEPVPAVEAILFGGEQLTLQDAERWWRSTTVFNTYGPSECTSISVSNYDAQNPLTATRIGKGAGVVTWVVDPGNHNRLTPLGAVGELLLEGPLLGEGYLVDPERIDEKMAERMAAAYIEDPIWLLQGSSRHPGRHGRLYKTGDLVRYNEDGSLSHVGRKDAQVKIRGQRVELGEVEVSIRQYMNAKQLAAEVITPGSERETANPILAVFMEKEPEAEASLLADESEERKKGVISVLPVSADVQGKLAQRLPRYMVPTVCFTLIRLPRTATDKIDRKRLLEIGASFSAQQLADRTQLQGKKRMPSTDAERILQQLFARVLHIDPQSIGADDSFFLMGGDSIAAMRLVAEARKDHLQLSVADLFEQPQLSDLAALTRSYGNGVNLSHAYKPYSLISDQTLGHIMSHLEISPTHVDPSDVEDIIPTTSFQQIYLRYFEHKPTVAMNYFSLHLGAQVDIHQLRDACGQLLDRYSILRAIFFPNISLHELVVLRKANPRFERIQVNGDLETAAQSVFIRDKQQELLPGSALIAFFLLSHKTLGHRLIVRISHAQYDGVSLPLIVQTLLDAYCGRTLESHPQFSVYLAHVESNRSQSATYWRKTLRSSHVTSLRQYLPPIEAATPRSVEVECSISMPELPRNLTPATLVSSAWALVLSSITGQKDVVYGQVVAGRNASIPGVETIVGPCANIIPVRARVHSEQSALDLLTSIQHQAVSLGESDSMGLQDIINECTDWPSGTGFDTIINHVGSGRMPEFQIGDDYAQIHWFEHEEALFPHLDVFSTIEEDEIKLHISGDSNFFSPSTADVLLGSLRAAIIYLSQVDRQLKEWSGNHSLVLGGLRRNQ